MNYIDENQLRSKVQFAPGDKSVIERFNNNAVGDISDSIWDGSYWMSPTLWINPALYTNTSLLPPAISTNNASHWRLNRTDNAPVASAKVMVFERFDFSKKDRTRSGGGREPYPPTYSQLEATARFVTVDGSVSQVKIADLWKLTTYNSASTTPLSVRTELTPLGKSDGARITDALLAPAPAGFDMANDGLQITPTTNPGYAFFWATRNGINGRDLNR